MESQKKHDLSAARARIHANRNSQVASVAILHLTAVLHDGSTAFK